MVKKEYAPKSRFVVEVSKPRILGAYLNGEQIDPDSLQASVRADDSRIWVEVTQEVIEDMTGEKHPFGSFTNMEVVFVEAE